MAASKSKRQEVADLLHTGGKHAGDMLWWSLTDAVIKAGAFRQQWKDGGLDEKYLPEDPTPGRALRSACKSVFVGQEDFIFAPANTDKSMAAVYAVMERARPDVGRVVDTQVARVAVDKNGGFLTDDPAHPIVQAVRAKYDDLFGCFQAKEVRMSIKAVLHDHAAVTLREHGGVYWLPPQGAQVVRALQACIAQVGGSEVAVLPVFDSKEGNATLGAAAHGSIEAELKALEAELVDFAKRAEGKAPEEPALQASTLENRLEEFDRLRSRANLYRTVLAVKVDDLDAKLSELEAQAKTILGVVEAAEGGTAAA